MGICKLCTNGYWAVNGTPIYVPSSVEIENDNIVTADSGRAESGAMYISWVRPTVPKVKLTYEHITGAEVAFMHNLMQGKEFNFTYYDNGIKTMAAYCGKDSYKQKNLGNYTREGGEYFDFTFNVEATFND